MTENRKSKRFALMALAEVTLPNGRNIPTHVSNISRDGLGIYFREPLDSGTVLNIKLFYRNMAGHMQSKKLKGQVKWAFDGFNALGLSFDNMDDNDNADLLEYIEAVEARDGQRLS